MYEINVKRISIYPCIVLIIIIITSLSTGKERDGQKHAQKTKKTSGYSWGWNSTSMESTWQGCVVKKLLRCPMPWGKLNFLPSLNHYCITTGFNMNWIGSCIFFYVNGDLGLSVYIHHIINECFSTHKINWQNYLCE